MLLMVNPPAWSLGIELLFYALAPFLARRKASWTVTLFALGVAARMVLIGSHSLTGLTADRFFPTALPFFLAGMLACRWRAAITRHPTSSWIAVGGTILCVLSIGAASVAGIRAGIPGQLFGLVFAGVAFVGIPALFAFSNSPLVPAWVRRWDAEMGALSYPAYLVHWQVITAFDAFLPETPMRSALIVAAVLSFAAILTRWVEEPIDRYRDRRRKRRPAGGEISEARSPSFGTPSPAVVSTER
jgi:peptidoglycan/LPS O-acetylase OafA/YrhL